MPKTKISEFSATPANNTDIDSINIAEGCAPSGINDAIRELMAQLKDFQTGAVGDSFNGPVGTTTAAAGAFTTLSASGAVTLSGGTANGVAYLNGSKVVTSGSALTFDGSGNLGLGVTLSAWADYKALQMPGAAFLGYSDGSGNNQAIVAANCYWNGANWIYRTTDQAARYSLFDGQAIWYNAPSGTAGNAITFTQAATITADGDFLVGTTTNAGSSSNTKQVNGGSFRSFGNTAAIPANSTGTILTLSSSVTGVYIVNANFGPQGNAIYGGMLIVVANNGSFRIVTNGGGSSSALSLSGANVQITNAIGAPLDATASAIFIGN